MMAMERLPSPDFLRENFVKWGRQYAQRRAANPGAKFFWTTYQGTKVNLLLLPPLKSMTAAHCSFCDGFPVETIGDSIEHFIPKSRDPTLAYQWENLFYCCPKCQESKLEQFDTQLLRPDALDYSFDYYFQYDTKSGRLLPNVDRTSDEQRRAEKTIELYGLNKHGRPEARKRTLRMFMAGSHELVDFPYRFVLL